MEEIHIAAEKGNAARVAEIIKQTPAKIHALTTGNVPNDTPLHLAASQGRNKVVILLLDAGANINAQGDQGRTPLYYAVERRSPSVLKTLLQRGADPNIPSDFGSTALYLAASTQDTKIASLLRKHHATCDLNSMLHLEGSDKVIQHLHDNPNLVKDSATVGILLNDSIRTDALELTKYLLDHGVSPNEADWMGTPPLFTAISSQSIVATKLLLESGADVKIKSSIGQGPLGLSKELRAGNQIMAALKKHGATD